MANRQVLYSATVPLQGAALTTASYELKPNDRGYVPYFVSGPLSREGYVGLFGTVFHVAAWIMAIVFDIMIGGAISQEQSPGAFTYWLWGFLTLLIGFVVLLIVTVLHATTDTYKVPEGGAPPFIMTLFIAGAQISLLLTILQMVASTGSPGGDSEFWNYANATTVQTVTEQKDWRNAQRGLMVWSMLCKVYIVNFLKNNQECKCYASSTSVLASVRCPFLNVLTCLVLCTQGPVPLASSRSRSSRRRKPSEKDTKSTPPPSGRLRYSGWPCCRPVGRSLLGQGMGTGKGTKRRSQWSNRSNRSNVTEYRDRKERDAFTHNFCPRGPGHTPPVYP